MTPGGRSITMAGALVLGSVLACFALGPFAPAPATASAAEALRFITLRDGVEVWTQGREVREQPVFFDLLERLFRVVLPEGGSRPFGESVAFLVGVSAYEHLAPQLPFVRNDIVDMKDFLLHGAGFDRVLVARDGVASRELVEHYMANVFRLSLDPEDRLLFYYAGHGGDFGGTTGYIQFRSARPDDFARHVLPIHQSVEWSRFIPAKHVVFIFDSCASGLAFTSRSRGQPSERDVLATLDGNGSRTVISAGTASEQTYEVVGASGRGNGVFTRALLDALTSQTGESEHPGFLTLDEVFARAYVRVQRFAAMYGKTVTPRMWKLQESRYRGTFLFLDPSSREDATPALVKVLGGSPRRVDGSEPPLPGATGSLSVTSDIWAEVSLDDSTVRQTPSYFSSVPVGRHTLSVRRRGYEEQVIHVFVQEGRTTQVRITMKPSSVEDRRPPARDEK